MILFDPQPIYRKIDIDLLADFKKVVHDRGLNYRIRYRGPRRRSLFGFGPVTKQGQRECLKEHATGFTAYLQGPIANAKAGLKLFA
jgi:hypothetical protein